jgi:hypothetical protein
MGEAGGIGIGDAGGAAGEKELAFTRDRDW